MLWWKGEGSWGGDPHREGSRGWVAAILGIQGSHDTGDPKHATSYPTLSA